MTNYLYDELALLEEVDTAGNALARYVHTNRVDEPLSILQSGTTSYYTQDGLGSISSLSSGTGAIVNTYQYDLFGLVTNANGNLFNPLQYTGREFDEETGVYFDI